jgi:hypothetical protein
MSVTNIAKTVGNVQGVVGEIRNAGSFVASYFAYDVTGVFDENFLQVFKTARPVKANISVASKLMDHPIEDGSIVTDFRILLPEAVELNMILLGDEYAAIYRQIKQSYTRGDLLTITTKVAVFYNMMIETMPHDENPEMADAIPLSLRLRYVQIIKTQYQSLPPAVVAKPKQDVSTVKQGAQQPQNSLAYDGVQAIKKFFGN